MDAASVSSLLTPAEMAAVDAAAARAGAPGPQLMLAAGQAVADAVAARWTPRDVLVMCGPGNNGGDGFVIARLLCQAGWPVRLALLGDVAALPPDAAHHAALWQGGVEPLSLSSLQGAELVVDALFGAGLRRPLSGVAADVVDALNACHIPVCAVDVPSGLDGASGQHGGAVVQADLTVTFCRKKPAHLLLPGRLLCGKVVVADIGIPAPVLAQAACNAWENAPALWRDAYPWPAPGGHKYHRGHVLVAGSATMTGAARLAAMAAARIGAGLTTIAAPQSAMPIYAQPLCSLMFAPCEPDRPGDMAAILADERKNVFVLGPGAGVSDALRRQVLQVLAAQRAVVLDADAISAFAGAPSQLFDAIAGPCVLTPHEGEFQRLFPQLSAGDKLARARQAAAHSGAVVLLKGADTVIAAPDGRVIINANAPAWLATGGAGDVLSGMIAGLMAQGMTPWLATAAAAWLHGQAARRFGPGLVADDLVQSLPRVLRRLYRETHGGEPA